MGKPRLNQIVAVVAGKKSTAEKALTSVYHLFQKPDLFAGLTRTFIPKGDGGDERPSEKKNPQHRVTELYASVENDLLEMFDSVATQDWSNCQARASVVVNGKVIVPGAPVSFLLFLEKRLVELKNFIEKLPLRDGAEDWTRQDETALFVTPINRKQVTAKVQEPLVLYPATPQHPAQTQLISKDVVTGWWEERKFSSAITQVEQDQLLVRVRQITEAVKVAREEANSIEVDKVSVGQPVLDYIFGGILK